MSFRGDCFFGRVGQRFRHWVTIFENEKDDEFDGELGEQDEDVPRILLDYTIKDKRSTSAQRSPARSPKQVAQPAKAVRSPGARSSQKMPPMVVQFDLKQSPQGRASTPAATSEDVRRAVLASAQSLAAGLNKQHDELAAEEQSNFRTLSSLQEQHGDLIRDHDLAAREKEVTEVRA